MQSVSIKEARKYYARLGFAITKSNGFFVQKSVGKNGKLFNVYKIKTMKKINGIDTTITSSNDVRITKSGKFFRVYNEVPTILMLVIVAMVVLKPF